MKKSSAAILCALALSLAGNSVFADSLDEKSRSIVAISAYTAQGDMEKLDASLVRGLEAGLTVNEIKEVMVHAYAYCGFPRCLRALQTFIIVLDERKEQGVSDTIGREAAPVSDTRDKYTRGAELLSELSGAPVDAPKTGYAKFAPIIEQFLKESYDIASDTLFKGFSLKNENLTIK